MPIMNGLSNNRRKLLDGLQADAFKYFLHEVNPANGLVVDCTKKNFPSSIAATGLALSAYPLGVERGFLSRGKAVERILTTLRFFANSEQSQSPEATGYKGFYYHFLDMKTGRRTWDCELSTVDSAFLVAGMLAAAVYFDRETQKEEEIRTLADGLYRRVDWHWATNRAKTLTHGWKPKTGFLRYRWKQYDEALLLYVLGLGSPTFPLPPESYRALSSRYKWKKIYGYEYLYASPLFTHQFSHIWLDLREIQDEFMRKHDLDYFENSRRATYVQQEYARRNPKEWKGYSEVCWGLTACEGPGPKILKIKGKERVFRLRRARRTLWSRRRHGRAVGRRGFTAFRARDRSAHVGAFQKNRSRQTPLRFGSHLQHHLSRQRLPNVRLALALALRHQSRTDRADDRKSS